MPWSWLQNLFQALIKILFPLQKYTIQPLECDERFILAKFLHNILSNRVWTKLVFASLPLQGCVLCVQGWMRDQNSPCDVWTLFLILSKGLQSSKISQSRDKQLKQNYSWQFEFPLVQSFESEINFCPPQLLSPGTCRLKPVVHLPLWNGKQCRPVHPPRQPGEPLFLARFA